MGTGSSRSTAQITLNMAGPARLSSVNNINNAGLVNEEDIVTKTPDRVSEAKDFPVNPTSALTLFTEKHPEIAPTLRTTKDHYHALLEAQNDGNLISLAAFQHVKGLYDAYVQDKSPKNRCALTEFAVALGIPKFAYEVIVDSRTKYQDLTTWDREKDAEGSKAELGVRAEEQVSSLSMHACCPGGGGGGYPLIEQNRTDMFIWSLIQR